METKRKVKERGRVAKLPRRHDAKDAKKTYHPSDEVPPPNRGEKAVLELGSLLKARLRA